MEPTIYSYFRISDTKKELAKLYKNKGQNVIFLVPTTLDKDALTDIITDYESLFGDRPQIMSMGELYAKLAEQEHDSRHVIDPPDHKLILKYVLNKYLTNCNIEQLPAGVKHKGFVSLLSDNIHTLIREAVSPSLLYEKVVCELSNYAPESILYNLYKSYLDYLNTHRLIDSIQTPDRLLELVSSDGVAKDYLSRHTLVVVGFSSFTGNQLKLFKQLEQLFELAYFMPRTGMVGRFRGGIEQLGLAIDNKHRLETDELKIRQLVANGQSLEFSSIAREIALTVAGKSTLFDGLTKDRLDFGRIGILCSAATLDAIENELRRYQLPYFVSLRSTVADTALGKFPSLIWTAFVSGWDTEETAFLLADTLLSPSGFYQRKFIERFVRGETAWRDALANISPDTSNQFDEIVTFCKKIDRSHTPAEILEYWRDFLDKLNIAQNMALLAENLPEYDFVAKNFAFSLKELDKKINILKNNGREIGEADDVKYAGAEAIEYLLDWATTATLPIQLPQKNAIALYGATPPTFTQHDFWIMTDADGNSWPGKLKESPLLRKEQLELINQKEEEEIDFASAHIPTLRDQREQKEMLFRRLLATGRKATIVATSATDANGRPVPENSFLAELSANDRNNFYEAPWNILQPAVKYTLADAMPKTDEDSFCGVEISEATQKNYRGEFPRVAHFLQDSPTISLSALDTWIACPYRYWCKLMRLEQWKSDSYNRILAGNLSHKLWELYWRTDEAPRDSFTDFAKKNWNNEIVQEEYKSLFSDRLSRYCDLLKEQTQNVAVLLDMIEPKARTAGRTEVKAEFVLKDSDGNDFEIDGVRLRGKVDRIDLYPGNKAVILDYKLNNAEKHKDELQLAAYGYLLKQLYKHKIAGYAWIGHADGKLYGYFTDEMKKIYGVEELSVCLPEEKLQSNLNTAEEKLKEMAAAVLKGDFKAEYYAKNKDRKSVCLYCEYAAICRKREAPGYIEESEEQD